MEQITEGLMTLGPQGGRLRLAPVSYPLTATVEVDQPCVCLDQRGLHTRWQTGIFPDASEGE